MASVYIELPPAPQGTGDVISVNATDPITSTGGTDPVIAMPQADATHDGYLAKEDWSTFNDKQSAAYTPSDSLVWEDPQPTTIQEAIDRIAAVVGAMTPIP